MAFSLVVKTATANSATTSPVDTTGANLLIVVSTSWGDTSDPTDNMGNTFLEGITVISGSRRLYVWYCINPTVGAGHTVTKTGNAASTGLLAYSASSPTFDQASAGASGNGTSAASGSFTPAQNGSLIISGLLVEGGNKPYAVDSGLTIQNDEGAGGAYNLVDADLVQTTAAAINPTWTWTGAENYSVGAVAFYEAVSATVDQEGVRFGLDDGNEASHTWKAAQDVNVTHPLGTNLLVRAILDAAGDPASFSPALRYQKNGSGGYVAVPVGASSTAYNSPGQPTSATGTTVGTAASSWTINRPTAAAGDLVVFVLAWDDSTNTTSVSAPAGPNGETAVSIAGPVASASTEMRMQAWYYIASGAWSSGTLVFTPNASETVRAAAWVAATAGNFDAADPIGWSNTAASAGTAETTVNSPTGTAEANDGNGRLVIAYGSDADAITAPASGTTTVDNTTGGGVGLCVVTRNTLVSNSESVAAIAATIASDSWASIAFVIKPDVDVTANQVYVATSTQIAAGGEATTARLTAPSGKTTSDFTTGRRWDDENGTDAIDIASDFYTEVEWCLRAQAPAAQGDYFDFRVYNGSSPLSTYSVTPRWMIGNPLAMPPLRSARSAAMQAIYTR
jgi:hypothetical protein